jgi:hypothetical protein
MAKQSMDVVSRLRARSDQQRIKVALLEFVAILTEWDQGTCKLEVPADSIHPPWEIGDPPQ